MVKTNGLKFLTMKNKFILHILFFTGFIMVSPVEISFAQNNQIDSLLSRLEMENQDTAKVNILNSIFSELNSIDEYDRAKKYANDALLLAHKIGFRKGEAKAYNNIGI